MLKLSRIFLPISGLLCLVSVILFVYPGPRLAIDFTGGTLMEVSLPEETTKEDISTALASFEVDPPLGNVALSQTVEGSVFLRMRDLQNEEHIALLDHLTQNVGEILERQFTTIGPTVGATLKKRAFWALGLAAIAIILYIAFAFRKVPRRLSPWRFGIIAVITLCHDVLITVGIFVLLSNYTAFEFDTLFVTALLTIIGYSVNDTIVIFDRIRENLFLQERSEDFATVAERGLLQSIPRSIHTSLSTLIMLSALFLLGSDSIAWFVLALMVGAVIGTYSSIFLATPLLVYWRKKGTH
jgi:preprotein translocase subunit SecF